MPACTTSSSFVRDDVLGGDWVDSETNQRAINGTAERWIGSCRLDLQDHIIALNERYLLRLLREYVSYYHQDRIHDSLGKDTPESRPVERKPQASATVISLPRLGGLNHRSA